MLFQRSNTYWNSLSKPAVFLPQVGLGHFSLRWGGTHRGQSSWKPIVKPAGRFSVAKCLTMLGLKDLLKLSRFGCMPPKIRETPFIAASPNTRFATSGLSSSRYLSRNTLADPIVRGLERCFWEMRITSEICFSHVGSVQPAATKASPPPFEL